MTLSEKHRSELYTYFEPRLGGDVTEAMLKEFPKDRGDELVTRDYLDLRLEAFEGQLLSRLATYFIGTTTLVLSAIAIATTVVVAVG
jgi:hypothetical protein